MNDTEARIAEWAKLGIQLDKDGKIPYDKRVVVKTTKDTACHDMVVRAGTEMDVAWLHHDVGCVYMLLPPKERNGLLLDVAQFHLFTKDEWEFSHMREATYWEKRRGSACVVNSKAIKKIDIAKAKDIG